MPKGDRGPPRPDAGRGMRARSARSNPRNWVSVRICLGCRASRSVRVASIPAEAPQTHPGSITLRLVLLRSERRALRSSVEALLRALLRTFVLARAFSIFS